MKPYKYFPPSRTPYEMKICEFCNIEQWINKNSRFCTRNCWYNFRRASNKMVPTPWDQNKMGDRVKDFESNWDYIKADPDRLQKHRNRSSRDKQATRQWLANYKSERGCIDCGYNTHFSALQMDHTGEKSIEISSARSSIKRLQQEIDNGKCVVRCANCHSIKTWCTKNGVEYDPKDFL